MEQKDIKILIVDDDTSFGTSLKESLIKANYKSTFLATTPSEAIFYNENYFINCFVIDCLLPQMQGLDLALKLKEMGNFNEKTLFFMSGVFQKSEILSEIQHEIQVKDFLSKPFSADILINKLNQQFTKSIKNNFVDLIFSENDLSAKKRLSVVSEIQRLHGFLLPQVIKLLLSIKISGTLGLKINHNKQYVYFSKGKIVFIEFNQIEKRFFFGDILIKKNILSFEDVRPFLNGKYQGKIGERLVNANLISPHIIDVITKEQLKMRLSTLIKDVYYELSFEEMSEIPSNKQANFITQKCLKDIYIQYLQSIIPVTYIKQIYLNHLNHKIQINPDFSLLDIHSINNEKIMDVFISIRDKSHSIFSLLNKYPDYQAEVYFTVHSLLLSGIIYFQKNIENVETVQAKILRLKRVLNNLKNQNYFETLNVSRKAKNSDIKQAYKAMSVNFYPNEANFQGSEEVKNLLTSIFSHIKKAHDILLDPQKRNDYDLSLEHKNFEAIFKSKQLFKKAKEALHNGNKKYSLQLLEKVMEMESSPSAHVLLYFIWSQLANSYHEGLQNGIDKIEKHFGKISLEDRGTSLFYFVRGLFYKTIGDKEKAINHLKYANHLDPLFKEAKQELQALVLSSKKPINIFKSDLKDVIKNIPFFKRKIG